MQLCDLNFLFNFDGILVNIAITVKPVYNDHPWDPNIVTVVHRWSLFRDHLCCKSLIWDLKMVAVVDRRLLFGGGRLLKFDCLLNLASSHLFCLNLNLEAKENSFGFGFLYFWDLNYFQAYAQRLKCKFQNMIFFPLRWNQNRKHVPALIHGPVEPF